MSMFSDENIIDFLENEKYNLSAYICVLQYVEMTNKTNLQIFKLLCEYAEELLDLVNFIERCFPNMIILTEEDKRFLEEIKKYQSLLLISDKLKQIDMMLNENI